MKKIALFLALPLMLLAHTMPELFEGLKNHSQTKVDEMQIQEAEVSHSMATAKLYPKVNLFAKYDYYTDPTGMLPVAPNDLLAMVRDTSVAQPFSQNITREGINFTMPLFVKSIFTMANRAQMMQKSAQAKKRINLLKNEALIVGSNANLLYLKELEKSLDAKEDSIDETKKIIKIKVNNGRLPMSALYKIEDAKNQINITKNSIALQKEKLLSTIKTLTGIYLDEPIVMIQANPLNDSHEILSLEPLKLKVEANKLNAKAQTEKLYPSVAAYGNYSYSQANAYNNNVNVNESYGNVGVVINIPLLAMDEYKNIKKAKVVAKSDEVALQKLQDELTSRAKMLQNSLPLLEKSEELSQNSISNREKLLAIAKVNYKSGRMTTEEYLRYEDDVVSAKAKLYKTEAQKWQTVMELAVIYANNIEEMIK